MLDTLIKIGKWRAEKMEPIERFLTEPKKLNENKTYYVAEILFDIDEHDIKMNILKKLDVEKDKIEFLLLKTLPGNNKAIYATTEKDKIEGLLKSFFGKIDKTDLQTAEHGELYLKSKETGVSEDFLRTLDAITTLKDVLLQKITVNKKGEEKLDPKNLNKEINLKKGEDIAIITASVKYERNGYPIPKPLAQTNE
jgi:transposase